MKLDNEENLELDIRPNEKILVIWFFTKTLTYSMATMFFVFMILFFINTLSITSQQEPKTNAQTIDSTINQKEMKDEEKEDTEHPFSIIIDYWGWALILVGLISIVIQIYFAFLRKTYRYIITDRRCVFVGGILKRIERSVPFKKITDIQRTQNIVERMLGIWNVQIFTPGTASMQIGQTKARAELNFDGLLNSEELYETINRHTQLNG